MNKEKVREIKQAMTPGEFGPINKFVANRPYPERMANTAARSMAVNETFVKNINPLAIGSMVEALEACSQYFAKNKIKSAAGDLVGKAIKELYINDYPFGKQGIYDVKPAEK